MAEKSDPSIYEDRTTIGSSEELDEYGVWVKSEAQDLSASLPDIDGLPDIDEGDLGLPDFSSLEDISTEDGALPDLPEPEAPVSDSAVSSLEFEEISEDSELPEGPAPIQIDKDGFTEVSMNDLFASAPNTKAPESVDFGDLDSSVPEIETLESPPPAAAGTAVRTSSTGGSAGAAADLSTKLLQKIADELSSIKKELSGLKKELSVVRGETKEGEGADAAGGFFDEEDDEKIALTGDELDNILNTANFTEEAGSNESLDSDLSFEALPPEDEVSLPEKENLLDEGGETAEISFDEVSELDGAVKVEDEVKSTAGDFEVSLDLASDLPDFDESPELNTLREEGALPITPAPENTSYLDEDPLAAEKTDDAADFIDFSGAVIDEPDLSADITEKPVTEPSIDNISIDLEMEEPVFPESTGADDFVFETEETMEIPVTEEPGIIDDISVPPQDMADSGFEFPPVSPLQEENLASSDDIDFTETMPRMEEIGPSDMPQPVTETAEGHIPSALKQELKTVLSYMDQLLESLPEEKIEEFAKSEYFDTYKKLFEELGLV